MRASCAVAALCVMLSSVAGAEARVSRETPAELKARMHVFLSHLLSLQAYMTSSASFSEPRNAATIKTHLKALNDNARGLEHLGAMKTPGFAVSAEAMQDHVLQMQGAFDAGRKEYARWMLTETVSGCISCHSQLRGSTVALAIDPATIEGTPLERADFLFATRQFDAALALYTQIIADYRPSASRSELTDGEPAETAVRRQLAIYLRVWRDPTAAAKSLEADRGNRLLPPALQDVIGRWIAELRKPGLVPRFTPATATRKELETYATHILRDDLAGVSLFGEPSRTATYLMLSGVLYESLATSHDDLSASEILRWLATCDRTLSHDFFFSLSDLYLQECIRRAPHTAVAKACFGDLKESVELAYTGSRGTEIPDDVGALLERMKALSR